MDDIKKLINKYKKNKMRLSHIINVLLVHHDIRKGAAIEFTRKESDRKFYHDVGNLVTGLGLYYKFVFDDSLFLISSKKIPIVKSSTALGKFLGFQCASEDFWMDEVRKPGKFAFETYIENPLTHVTAEVCPVKDKWDYVKILKYYQEFVKKANKVLDNYNLRMIIRFSYEKNDKEESFTWIK